MAEFIEVLAGSSCRDVIPEFGHSGLKCSNLLERPELVKSRQMLEKRHGYLTDLIMPVFDGKDAV